MRADHAPVLPERAVQARHDVLEVLLAHLQYHNQELTTN